jgi:hypothetical protein
MRSLVLGTLSPTTRQTENKYSDMYNNVIDRDHFRTLSKFSLKQSPGFVVYEFVPIALGTDNLKDTDKILSN